MTSVFGRNGVVVGQTGDYASVNLQVNNLLLPNTTSSAGSIELGGTRFLSNYGTNNTFLGSMAGNTTETGVDNTGVGYRCMETITSGSDNTAYGNLAMGNPSGSFITCLLYTSRCV